MAKRISVVLSQGQSANPVKREFEENLVAALLMERGVDMVVIPHLYDLTTDGTGVLALQQLPGHVVVLSWLYERAARWTLDRFGVRGQTGITTIKPADDEDDDDGDGEENSDDDSDGAGDGKERVIDTRPVPPRKIYCLDLRVHDRIEPYLEEVRRIVAENQIELVDLMGWIGGSPRADQLERYQNPRKEPVVSLQVPGAESANSDASAVTRVDDSGNRRWYPVIDYSRCTNCMECIDFCLFGVYGVDKVETILVEQPDNCRKGCPACSRVCPENAIIFPQHKTPAIAGADVAVGGLKIDLSRLFGAPDGTEDAATIAARERDEQLRMAGRQPAANASADMATSASATATLSVAENDSIASVSVRTSRQSTSTPTSPTSPTSQPTPTSTGSVSATAAEVASKEAAAGVTGARERDELDSLIDALDDLDL